MAEAAVQAPGPAVTVAYLVNQYPKVSHTFIRREVHALERQGVKVLRYAVRGWDADLVDDGDRSERDVTRYLLRGGPAPLLQALAWWLVRRPRALLGALRAAMRLGARGADRPLPYHFVYLAEACLLARWLAQQGATHLHAHFGTNAAEVALLVHHLQGTPYSFTVHGPEEFDRPQALRLAEKMRHAGFVVAISSYGRSQLYRWLPAAAWDRVKVVHCGLDPAFVGELPKPAPGRRLVCIGRLCEQKGQLLLLDAARRVLDAGVDFELVLAGDGEMRPAIEARIAALGLQRQVRITGWISSDQVRQEIVAARALVLPSFAEGLPVVLMEAMALGRPVVSTYVAGIPELVLPGETGWLVPAGDTAALAQALQQCLQASDDQLATMGPAARRRCLARHDVDEQASTLARLLGRPHRAAPT